MIEIERDWNELWLKKKFKFLFLTTIQYLKWPHSNFISKKNSLSEFKLLTMNYDQTMRKPSYVLISSKLRLSSGKDLVCLRQVLFKKTSFTSLKSSKFEDLQVYSMWKSLIYLYSTLHLFFTRISRLTWRVMYFLGLRIKKIEKHWILL